MQDIRQSRMYMEYMRKIGWVVEEVDGAKVFIKRFPLVGSFIKIQRPERAPSIKLVAKLAKKYGARNVSLEYFTSGESFCHPRVVPKGLLGGVYGFTINNSPYLPTKTIQIDLTASEEKIFQRFTEAKRRAVRKAIKNGGVVKEANNIEEFIKLKAKDFWPLVYFMKKDVIALWESFWPGNASVMLAYTISPRGSPSATSEVLRSDSSEVYGPIAGILLLFYDGIAYYWMAAATDEGKKLFAPTLLVWEALKLAKKRGCRIFDFEGVYDNRFHSSTKKWQGFTKFKEGFGGEELFFPEPILYKRNLSFW